MYFNRLKQKIEDAVKQVFLEMYEQHKEEEEIYAFALYSDEGAMTVCPSTNTVQFFDEYKNEDDWIYYKYEPAEWKYEMQRADSAFNEISNELYEEVIKISDHDEDFKTFQQTLYKICVEVLEKLKNENFFKQITGKDIFLIFTVSDYDFSKQELENIIVRLNDNEYKTEYLNWIKSWKK